MILKNECHKLDITVQHLSDACGVPIRTLQDWTTKHPKRVLAFLDAIRFRQLNTGDKHLQGDLL